MYKAWKRANVFIFAALIFLLVPFSPALAQDVRGVTRGDLGMSVEARDGKGGIVGRVVDVTDNGEVTIALRGTDRDVTVRGGQVHVSRGRVLYEGSEDQLHQAASASGERRYRGYYDDRDRDRDYYRDRDRGYDRDRDYRDRDRGYYDDYDRRDYDYRDRDRDRRQDRDNFSLKDLFS